MPGSSEVPADTSKHFTEQVEHSIAALNRAERVTRLISELRAHQLAVVQTDTSVALDIGVLIEKLGVDESAAWDAFSDLASETIGPDWRDNGGVLDGYPAAHYVPLTMQQIAAQTEQ